MWLSPRQLDGVELEPLSVAVVQSPRFTAQPAKFLWHHSSVSSDGGLTSSTATSSATLSPCASPPSSCDSRSRDDQQQHRRVRKRQQERGASSSPSTSPIDSSSSADRVRPDHWMVGENIGSGSFGRVYKAMNADSGVEFAVKEVAISSSRTNESGLEELTREIMMMQALSHPNVVRYLGFEVHTADAKLLIFQEWVPGNSLSSRLATYGKFSDAMTRRYVRQLLTGLAYLHDHGVMHNDLKCENLLLDKGGVVKLADFGTAARISDTGAQQGGRLGTPYFMAPEIIINREYTPKADMWSVGGAVLQMTTLAAPWQGMGFRTPVQLRRHMAATRAPPPIAPCVAPPLRALMLRCFARAPAERPDARTLLADPFLS
ncbi:kinase-like domain-containing protein, partial [Tribonema minus]